jgi:hypothetical protein
MKGSSKNVRIWHGNGVGIEAFYDTAWLNETYKLIEDGKSTKWLHIDGEQERSVLLKDAVSWWGKAMMVHET